MFYLKQVETLSRVTLSKPLATLDRDMVTPEAMEFLTRLHSLFEDRRRKLLARRSIVQRELDMGIFPDFIDSTRGIREGLWRVRPAPSDLSDRMVEIRVPAGNRKLVVDGLNSGANVLIADFEDSQSPTWTNSMEGQRNVRDAVRNEITYLAPDGTRDTLRGERPPVMIRPRGWHMNEKNFCLDGEPISASLFDAGMFLFHNAALLVASGSGPYFILPKLESRFEAALWNEVFAFSEEMLGLPASSIRATVQIDNVLAAFEMDEILYELRDRAVGLRCDRLNYVFSVIKKFRGHRAFVLPDRGPAMMDQDFLTSCITLLIQTCHRRGTYAIGGLSTELPGAPGPGDEDRTIDRVRREKLREAREGHDGTWIADPGLVDVTRDAFGSVMTHTNQFEVLRNDTTITTADLLRVSGGAITETGLRRNIGTAIRYIESWLSGEGALRSPECTEDASAAELSRAQVWQWLRHAMPVRDASPLTSAFFRKYFAEELEQIREHVGPERYRRGQFELASRIYFNLVHHRDFPPFFTTAAGQYL